MTQQHPKAQDTNKSHRQEAVANRKWLVFDASGKILGRFASEIAKVLRGKHRPEFTPSTDCGDGVIILNADKIRVTGAKRVQKLYRYYTGSIKGLREVPYETMVARNPAYIIEKAVKGMMPKNRLAEAQMKRLRVFAGSEHDMQAQNPTQVHI